MKATVEYHLQKNDTARTCMATKARECVSTAMADFEFAKSGGPSTLCQHLLHEVFKV